MYVKTNTVLYKQKQMYNNYINTKNFLWIRCFTNGLTCQTEKTDCLPAYPYTPPFFRGGGGCVRWWTVPFGDYRSGGPLWHFTITMQSIFVSEAVLWFYSTLFAYFEWCLATIYKQKCCHTPFYTAIKRRSTELHHIGLSSIEFYGHWMKWSLA